MPKLGDSYRGGYPHDVGTIGISDAVLLKTGRRHHHQRLDGSGYPDNLKGDDVPLLARRGWRRQDLVEAFMAVGEQEVPA